MRKKIGSMTSNRKGVRVRATCACQVDDPAPGTCSLSSLMPGRGDTWRGTPQVENGGREGASRGKGPGVGWPEQKQGRTARMRVARVLAVRNRRSRPPQQKLAGPLAKGTRRSAGSARSLGAISRNPGLVAISGSVYRRRHRRREREGRRCLACPAGQPPRGHRRGPPPSGRRRSSFDRSGRGAGARCLDGNFGVE